MNAEPTLLDPRAIQDLLTRVDAQFPPGRGRLIGFIASGAREGTSSVAQAYAGAAATQLRRRVLLLDAAADPESDANSLVGVLQALAANPRSDEPLNVLDPESPDGSTCDSDGAASVWELLPRTDLWFALRDRYDEVVIDLPAPSVSRVGLAVAPYCDGVAVVVEAERTRAPVAENLVMNLRSVRARVLGAVMNRRRFHLPARVYRML
jgi:Mrp family chromosome partitioning ATPase